MRLPDFLADAGLNDLRTRMGNAPLREALTWEGSPRLTEAELEVLITGGIDIKSLDDVHSRPDGTLAYKDRRVLLYIRDISEARGYQQSLPKFHMAECSTLQEMRETKRIARYVVAARADGQFQINRIGNGTPSTLERLAICKNCLDRLRFNGYSSNWAGPRRDAAVQQFSLKDFFEQYPRDILDVDGISHESVAALNDYSGDFGIHAAACKERALFHCDQCRIDLGAPEKRRYLHAHHVNGLKPDNSVENLRALCIGCHSEQPMHGHMKKMPQYAAFQAKR